MTKSPNPVDKHVGARLKLRRMVLGMSQEKLGEALGVTFQQIQKYEKGANRIGASRLQLAAKILGVPVNFFFEGDAPEGAHPGFADEASPFLHDTAASAEARQLIAAFQRIREPELRRRVLDLVEAMAGPAPTLKAGAFGSSNEIGQVD
jgi:transcriptional regulator with XRE-family HTH domain